MISDADLRQFKLSSGEELVCEIVQWNETSMELEVVVRKAMRLVMQESTDGTGVKFYSFRPWMVYQENEDDLLIINTNNIVGIGFPPETLIVQYLEAVEEMIKQNREREEAHNKSYRPRKKTPALSELEELLMKDSGGKGNVIDLFGDPTKLH